MCNEFSHQRSVISLTINNKATLQSQIFKRKNKHVKGALSGLRQFLATESPLKIMKNVF